MKIMHSTRAVTRRLVILFAAAMCTTLYSGKPATAAGYPERPIELIVPGVPAAAPTSSPASSRSSWSR